MNVWPDSASTSRGTPKILKMTGTLHSIFSYSSAGMPYPHNSDRILYISVGDPVKVNFKSAIGAVVIFTVFVQRIK